MTDDPFELGRQLWLRSAIAVEAVLPVGLSLGPLRGRAAPVLERFLRDVKVLVRVPAVELLGQANLILTERRAVCLDRVLLVRAAVADVRPADDQGGLVGHVLGAVRSLHQVVRRDLLTDVDHLPAVGLIACGNVLGEDQRRRARQLDLVVVVEDDQLAEAEVPGKRGGLGRDAFLNVPIGGDDPGEVVDDVMPVDIEPRGQHALSQRQADGHREPLTQRSGRRLDAG